MIFPSLIELESALLEHLAADRILTREWEVAIEPVPGFDARAFGKLFKRYPSVGTYITGGKYELVQQIFQEVAPIYLICAGQNLRGPAHARRGDERSPGAVHLVERCRAIIEQWQPGGNTSSVAATGWRQVWANNQISICVLTVEVALTRPRVRGNKELEHYGSTI